MWNKIKKFVADKHWLIIGILCLTLMLKGCESCSNERRLEYYQVQHELVIDSMQTVIDERSTNTKDLCDTIYSLRAENTILKSVIKDLKDDKIYYQKANKNLTNVAEALSKKDSIK
jgi:hypothetical protein